MNLQERLLQNEIKHLGQIVQTLSYELIVLQDFLKDEHGPKFDKFRASYSSSSGSSSISSSDAVPIHSQRQRVSKSERTETQSFLSHETDISVENDDGCTQEMEFNDSDTAYDEALSDSDTSMTLKDPLDNVSNDERKGGRKKTKIWKYFDKITHRNSKFSARCHICQGLVSSRASRMVEHRLKCKRKQHMKLEPKPDVKRNLAKEVRKEIKSVKMDDQGIGEFSEDESFLCSDNDQSSSEDKTVKRSGRSLDRIWDYYETEYQNDLKKAKCISCGQYVSPKAVRMRQHKIGCKGIAKVSTTKTDSKHEILYEDKTSNE